ncbi:MAG: nucleotidyltransferase [Candidatus Omnitrophica bacterium]|nr:nucleotidyltransferase [Candidatus Omnitrophota bacterium]
MSVSADQIERWGSAPSESTEVKCQKTVERIKRALATRFSTNVEIYLQGSYKNRTNVKLDSDVDIVVEHTGYYFHDISSLSPEDKQRFEAARTPADYAFSQFKSDVLATLQTEFGAGWVIRKNKCIFVTKDNNRVNADVVPCYTHKRFSTPTSVEAQGIAFVADDGQTINSFPKQHYENGASKNLRTNGRYKSAVRALKLVRNSMDDSGNQVAKDMPSFLLECLVWNVSDDRFSISENLYTTVRRVIYEVWDDMGHAEKATLYAEVSDLKWLLRGGDAARNIQLSRDFMLSAWNFIGYT